MNASKKERSPVQDECHKHRRMLLNVFKSVSTTEYVRINDLKANSFRLVAQHGNGHIFKHTLTYEFRWNRTDAWVGRVILDDEYGDEYKTISIVKLYTKMEVARFIVAYETMVLLKAASKS